MWSAKSQISMTLCSRDLLCSQMIRTVRKCSFRHACPVNSHIRLRIRAVWSESSLVAFWIARDAKVPHADNEDSDLTTRMRRLICVFDWRTCQKVFFSRCGSDIFYNIHWFFKLHWRPWYFAILLKEKAQYRRHVDSYIVVSQRSAVCIRDIGRAMRKRVFGHMPGSACASAQSDQGLRNPLTELLDIIECMNGEQMPAWDFAQAWMNLNLCICVHIRKYCFACRGPNM